MARGRRASGLDARADVGGEPPTPGDMPSILALERDTGAVRIDLSQCAWGSPFQKFTTLLVAAM